MFFNMEDSYNSKSKRKQNDQCSKATNIARAMALKRNTSGSYTSTEQHCILYTSLMVQMYSS